MKFFLVTTPLTSYVPGKTYHGPFSTRAAVESAAIAALSTSKFGQVQIEEDKDEEEEEEEEEDED